MELGEMKRNTSNWSNFCMLLRRAGFTASAGLSCTGDMFLVKMNKVDGHCHF